MGKISANEAFQFIRSYGWEPKMKELEQWIKEDPLMQDCPEGSMSEEWMYRFNDWRHLKDSAYEPCINLEEKTKRLLEEINRLKLEIKELRNKNFYLAQKLGETLF